MKSDYLIHILGTMQQDDGDVDSVELMTRGGFVKRGGNYFIVYKESEATGYDGSTTTVKVEDAHKVSMTRVGPAHSQLVIERGKRHVCHYESGVGSMSMGVAADEIENLLSETGGQVSFSYTLDSGNTQISHNSVKITIRENEECHS